MTAEGPREAGGEAARAVTEGSARARAQLEVLWAFSLTFGALATGDFVLAGEGLGPLSIAWAFGLGAGAGAVLGLLFGAAFAYVGRARPAVAWAAWLVAGGASGLALARALGAFSRLGTRHHGLALVTLAGSVLACLAFGVVCGWMQPRGEAVGRPRFGPAGSGARRLLVVALLVGAAGGLGIERTLFPGNYPPFHLALLLLAQTSVAFAALLVGVPARPRMPERLPLALLLVALIALPLATLDAGSPRRLSALADAPLVGFSLRLARRLLDFDGDGYAGRLGGGDCAPLRPAIHPGAAEIPDNGVDDNCVLGDGAPAPTAEQVRAELEGTPHADGPSPVSVVLVTVDTLRPDRMSAYGHGRPTTPRIDAFFRDGRRYDDAITPGGYTSIAIPALMRGVHARRIFWTRVVQTNRLRLYRPPLRARLEPGEEPIYSYTLPIDDPRPPLAHWLARRGMSCHAVVDDGGSSFLSPEWGTHVGFATYERVEASSGDGDARTADAAIRRLEALPTDRPFFLWVHFYGPHLPNAAHADAPTFGDRTADRYDHEVVYVDAQIGRLLDALAASPFAGSVVTVLTSDHGERFAGPQRLHGRDQLEAAVRVPLLVRGPGIPAGADAAVVSTVDLVPTVLSLTETPAPPGLDGLPLLGPRAVTPPPERIVFTETWVFDPEGAPVLDLVSALDASRRFALDRRAQTLGLYPRLPGDQEPPNLLGEEGGGALRAGLFQYLEAVGGAVRVAP